MKTSMDYSKQFLDVIMTRKSIRMYEKGNIPPEDIDLILQAGIMAPSPGNRQPWRFHVIRGETKKKLIEKLRGNGMNLGGILTFLVESLSTAPVIIAVENPLVNISNFVGETKLSMMQIGTLLGTAAAVENMLLAIHSLGYGSVWMGLPPILQAATSVLNPKGTLIGVMPVGYASIEQLDFIDRSRNPIESVTRVYD